MSNDKMREEFETAVALEAGEPVLAVYLSRRNDTYSTSTLHFAWWAWRASRGALVIELPKPMEGPDVDDVDDDYEQFEIHENTAIEVNGMRRQCMKAIEAAGLKVSQ